MAGLGGGEGMASEVLPPQKKGGQKRFEPCSRGSTKSVEVVSTWELEVLAILKGCEKKRFPVFKRGEA